MKNPKNVRKNRPKSQLVYCLLAFFLGIFGIHNFYARRWKQGLIQLFCILLCPCLIEAGFFLSKGLFPIFEVLIFFVFLLFALLDALVIFLMPIKNIFTVCADGSGKNFSCCKIAQYVFGVLSMLATVAYILTLETLFL